jgi:cytosine/adenosine deaminase-related metal-dependent hydrolase
MSTSTPTRPRDGADAPDRLLDRVRKLLAKAEAEGVTPEEAQALTAKAAELMAKYGIDRALLADARPETDRPADRIVAVYNPWAKVQAHLLCGLAAALRCQCILLTNSDGLRVHVFGYASDIERTDMLYTSVLVQMWHGLSAAPVPARATSVRAWRRSWLLGFAAAVVARVRAAEQRAEEAASTATETGSSRAALVLADRSTVIRENVGRAYPHTRTARITYSGSGYGAGYAEGKRADIGASRVGQRRPRSLTRAR